MLHFKPTLMNLLTRNCIAIGLLLAAGGCSDFLNETPQATIVTENYYADENEVWQGVVGAYDILGMGRMYNLNLWRLGSGGSDNMFGNTGAREVVEYTYGADAAIFRDTWRGLYEGIDRANLLIVNAPQAEDIPPETLRRYTAEAQFIRALCYFNLVNLFGGVPIIQEPLSPQALQLPRSTAAEVYALIEEDLLDGVASLPLESELGAEEKGRATKGAAQGMLAKVYLHQGKWEDAATQAQEVIGSKEYQLLDRYRDIFLLSNEGNTEIIFRVVFSNEGPQGWGDGNEGNEFSQWFRPLCLKGWGGFIPSDGLLTAFEAGDERRQGTVIEEGDFLVEPGFRVVAPDYQLQPGESFDESISPFGCKGWAKWWIKGEVQADRSPMDFIVLRLADIILVRAEALAEQGQWAEAVTTLNQVRTRAGLPDLNVTAQASAIESVRQERRVELAAEGTRLYDLRRWGTVIDDLKGADKNVQEGRDELFPIPQTEIDLHGGFLEQNPGW